MPPNPFKEGLFRQKLQAVNGYIEYRGSRAWAWNSGMVWRSCFRRFRVNWNMPDANFPARHGSRTFTR
jgi:hypothetical protein